MSWHVDTADASDIYPLVMKAEDAAMGFSYEQMEDDGIPVLVFQVPGNVHVFIIRGSAQELHKFLLSALASVRGEWPGLEG